MPIKKPFQKLAVATLIALLAGTASSSQIVKEFRGNDNELTAKFVVESPWILDWRLDGDHEALLALDITLIEARTGRHVGRVLHTKRRGNGVKLFNESGIYQLRISSTLARWRVKIEQLTPEEAELYTPKGSN